MVLREQLSAMPPSSEARCCLRNWAWQVPLLSLQSFSVSIHPGPSVQLIPPSTGMTLAASAPGRSVSLVTTSCLSPHIHWLVNIQPSVSVPGLVTSASAMRPLRDLGVQQLLFLLQETLRLWLRVGLVECWNPLCVPTSLLLHSRDWRSEEHGEGGHADGPCPRPQNQVGLCTLCPSSEPRDFPCLCMGGVLMSALHCI